MWVATVGNKWNNAEKIINTVCLAEKILNFLNETKWKTKWGSLKGKHYWKPVKFEKQSFIINTTMWYAIETTKCMPTNYCLL